MYIYIYIRTYIGMFVFIPMLSRAHIYINTHVYIYVQFPLIPAWVLESYSIPTRVLGFPV